MAGSLQSDTTMVALVISFVALCLSALQFLYALFASADGYRRCQSSVMGVWAAGTYPWPRPSQLRFETRFTTPHLVLRRLRKNFEKFESVASLKALADVDKKDYASGISNGSFKQANLVEGQQFKLRQRTLHEGLLSPGTWQIANRLNNADSATEQDVDLDEQCFFLTELGAEHAYDHLLTWPFRLLLKHRWTSKAKKHRLFFDRLLNRHGLSRRESRGQDLASWKSFIHKLYEMQNVHFLLAPAHRDQASHDNSLSESARFTESTYLACILEDTSWDFMPPDVVRPLATIGLSDLIIATTRLGMRWPDVDWVEGNFKAEGNGHSLTTFDVHGLGVVIRYQYATSTSFETRKSSATVNRIFDRNQLGRDTLIPNNAVDKMIFGIIPACGRRPDLPTADGYGHINLLEQSLEYLEMDLDIRTKLLQRTQSNFSYEEMRAPLTDLVSLWSPFMPLPGSHVVRTLHPLRLPRNTSAFLFWEGRKVLQLRLEETLREIRSTETEVLEHELDLDLLKQNDSTKTLAWIFEGLNYIEDTYRFDFYCCWQDAFLSTHDNMDPGDEQELKQKCGAYHLFTRHRHHKEEGHSTKSKNRPFTQAKAEALKEMRGFWDLTEAYFDQINDEFKEMEVTSSFRMQNTEAEFRDFQHMEYFTHLVSKHIKLASTAIEQALQRQEACRDDWTRYARFSESNHHEDLPEKFANQSWRGGYGKKKQDTPGYMPLMVYIAHLYVDGLDDLVKRMQEHYSNTEKLTKRKIIESWYVLAFRGICWFMGHDMMWDFPAIPSSLYQSQSRVWIT
ncbi:MAG: hypothetical protein M1822_002623 [Bathelium mastoideum]|nr:MAG: hypothetical protein M1822_002623 [Bathelium mastoideum]